MKRSGTIVVMLAGLAEPLASEAQETSGFAGAAASSKVIDRGEQLSASAIETELGVETRLGAVTAYAAI